MRAGARGFSCLLPPLSPSLWRAPAMGKRRTGAEGLSFVGSWSYWLTAEQAPARYGQNSLCDAGIMADRRAAVVLVVETVTPRPLSLRVTLRVFPVDANSVWSRIFLRYSERARSSFLGSTAPLTCDRRTNIACTTPRTLRSRTICPRRSSDLLVSGAISVSTLRVSGIH